MKKIVLALAVAAAFGTANAAQNVNTDVVVVGAGGAGLASAVEAHDLGAKVIVVEKMAFPGGNTTRAAGGLNAAATPLQQAKGIYDTPEIMFYDTMKGGHWKNNPDLVRTLAEHAKDSVDWLLALGGDFHDVGLMAGATRPRTHRPTGGALVGPEVIRTLYTAAENRKIDIRVNTRAESINKANGKVTGITVKGPDGEYTINAKAVVIAAGGFGANNAMVASYVPRLKGFSTTNHPGATGDGLKMAEKAGAALIDMTEIQTHPTVVPGDGTMITEAVRGNGAILVNNEGKRFYNELETRDKVSAAILKQPGKTAWLFFDSDMQKSLKATNGYIKQKYCLSANTLDELAAKMKVPAAALKATLKDYGAAVAAKSDKQFGRENLPRALNKAPFYAITITPAVHHTMGGVKIDTKTQVYDTTGRVIPGLFAAGEVTGGVHGGNRLGGNAQADIVTFGHIAGQQAYIYSRTSQLKK
ncbi:flavocytochrome c [Mesosutterella sp. AGMB02718]|uniref:Flavocytochrome c n=1 Tax=Mesosutterella faecium TaxID=2925194 RepID=A0ABT7INI9_9BURK|nr:flavocytochrome c [Mesosutterella sp. AGMB02718]MDL2059949.1 flavocytochrome c [Mesosutterella sp. AGMB02718]